MSDVLLFLIAAELTVVTGLAVGATYLGIAAVRKIKGTVGPIVGLVNTFGK